MPRRRIVQGKIDAIYRLRDEGLTYPEIAKRVGGVSTTTVTYYIRARKLGLSSSTELQHRYAEERGFASRDQYLDDIAREKGFKDRAAYEQQLARNKGFKDLRDYRSSLVTGRGFGSLSDYRRSQAEQRRRQHGNVEFSLAVRNALDKKGLSASEFAKAMGVNESAVYRWIGGNNLPSKPLRGRLCETLEIDPDTLEI